MNTPVDYNELFAQLSPVLDAFGEQTYYGEGLDTMNLGYARADFVQVIDDTVVITLEFGIQGDYRHIEDYSIKIQDLFFKGLTVNDKVALLREYN
jgi:hypothetical protein